MYEDISSGNLPFNRSIKTGRQSKSDQRLLPRIPAITRRICLKDITRKKYFADFSVRYYHFPVTEDDLQYGKRSSLKHSPPYHRIHRQDSVHRLYLQKTEEDTQYGFIIAGVSNIQHGFPVPLNGVRGKNQGSKSQKKYQFFRADKKALFLLRYHQYSIDRYYFSVIRIHENRFWSKDIHRLPGKNRMHH